MLLRVVKIALAMFLIGLLTSCAPHPGRAMTLSVSSDGQYAVTANENDEVLLWNIPRRSYQLISSHANGYNAYFIRGTHNFLWQGEDNTVHVQTISGKRLLSFKTKQTSYYGIITKNLRYFFYSDKYWNVYRYDTQEHHSKVLTHEAYASYIFAGKPINMSFSNNEKHLLTSGFCDEKFQAIQIGQPNAKLNLNCVTLWNVDTGKPIKKYGGNHMASQTYATISPNGHYVLAGDINGGGGLWSIPQNKMIYRNMSFQGKLVKVGKEKFAWDKKGFPAIPTDFRDGNGSMHGEIFSLKYITQDQYLRFTTWIPYAVLYTGTDPKPTKYLRLGLNPAPSVVDYAADQSIDTSPSAHILVTGQAVSDGINVYQYNPKTQILYLVWSPILHSGSVKPAVTNKVSLLPGASAKKLVEVKHEW
tara:strand:+ start:7755 stop:9005 length:1251 start_codon:yes stop_codon:yes gene_type:complete